MRLKIIEFSLFLHFINFANSLFIFTDINVSLYDPLPFSSNDDCRIEHYIDKLSKNILKLQMSIEEIDGEIKRFYETSQMFQKELEAIEFRKTISTYAIPLAFCLTSMTYLLISHISSLKSKLIIHLKRIKLICKYVFRSPNDCHLNAANFSIISKSKIIDQVANFNVKMFLLHRNSNINEYFLRHASCKKNFNISNLNLNIKCGGGCERDLLEMKRRSESFKITECGHVICARCANKLLKNKCQCPVCDHCLKRSGIIRVTNLYL
jgi:hypothetical protein